ncbi:MAG: o-succinylbenzoate--CoA ligase [Marinisporobacter sp.]|jgi:long-chain acyl-CoA synthetase|nr:o-succinylbenzoate--CoA ligase [Marinisporobacter sp.]
MFFHEIINQSTPTNTAIKSNGEIITYSMLNEYIERYRSYFNKIGIKPGDYVGLFYNNSPEFIYSYFAVSKMGAIIVPFNRMLTSNEIEYIANDTNMKHIITMATIDISTKYTQIVLPAVISEIMKTKIIELDQIDRSEDDVNTIIYTSGTTGKPKGAMLTHKNLISNAKSIIEYFSLNQKDIHLCVLPMFHSFAWTVNVAAALHSGACILIKDSFTPKNIINDINNEKVTIVTGVPAMFSYYLSLGIESDFASVRLFISGGDSLPVEVLKSFEYKFDKKIYEGYGLSETSPVVAVNPPNAIRPGSVGLPVPNVNVKIVDNNGKTLNAKEVGEILVKGPNVMKGYRNLPEETRKTIVDGWLHTGDIGYMDEDGYIYIVDRIKDIIIVGGMNVYPREIEELLYQYDGILEAAAVGVQDDKRGEIPMAYIVVKNKETFNLNGLKIFLRDNLAKFKRPKKIVLMDQLPKNATGKIMKRKLQAN